MELPCKGLIALYNLLVLETESRSAATQSFPLQYQAKWAHLTLNEF